MITQNNFFKLLLTFLLFCPVIVSFNCGGSSEQGNARTFISGSIDFDTKSLQEENINEVNLKKVFVQLVNENFTPYNATSSLIYTKTSDSSGNFTFTNITEGIYYLNSWDKISGFRAIYGPFNFYNGDHQLPELILRKARQIQAKIPDSLSTDIKALYIKGTTLKEAYIDHKNKTAFLDSVPAGSITINCTILSSPDDFDDITFANVISIENTDTITVTYQNSPPVINSSPYILQQNYSYYENYNYTINASDPDNDSLIFSIINAPPELSISPEGVINWLPVPDTVINYNYPIGIKISDTKGASVSLWWTVHAQDSLSFSPTPVSPVILSAGNIFTPGIFKAVSPCTSNTTQFRFYFSDGDTTNWSNDSIVSHEWKSYTPAPYRVMCQVKCNDMSPSHWSLQTEFILDCDSSILPPKPVFSNDSIIYLCDTLLDTFLIYSNYHPCNNNTQYQFYCNDTVLREWSTDSVLRFTPLDTGLHKIQISVLCLAEDTLISPFSESLNLYVKKSDTSILLTLPSPVRPEGDSIIYYSDTVRFDYFTNNSYSCSGGIIPYYRFEFSDLSDTILRIDTTAFSTNTSVSFIRVYPYGTYNVRVQLMCDDTTYSSPQYSEWSDYFTTEILP